MDAPSYTAALAELRTVRDEIKKARAVLAKLEADRDKRIVRLAAYPKAKAERIAPAAGLSVADVVTVAPALAPDSLTADDTPPAQPAAADPAASSSAVEPAPAPAPAAAAPAATVLHTVAAQPAAVPDCAAEPALGRPDAAPPQPRALPSIPEGGTGDAWFAHTAGLASTRPNFTQQARSTVFLDAGTGVLVHRQQTHRLDL
ncbi:hypothetical protein ACFV6E_42775, partial [Streptomyces sp. NPDC059785]